MKIQYACSVCKRDGIKLWRPSGNTKPLICATCAEELQTPQEYDECIWEKNPEGTWIGTPTGKKLPLDKWQVDEKGLIPSSHGIGHDELPLSMTDQLIIDLSTVSESYSSGCTSMLPAVPDPNQDDEFWAYTAVPEDRCKWWEELPTR